VKALPRAQIEGRISEPFVFRGSHHPCNFGQRQENTLHHRSRRTTNGRSPSLGTI